MNDALPVLVKATTILAVAGLATTVLARAAASVRHLIWLAAIAIVVLLPAAAWLSPEWTPVDGVTLAGVSAPRVVVDVVAGVTNPVPALSMSLFWVWLAGAGVVASRLASSYRQAASLTEKAEGFLHGDRVRISGEIAIPMVCGIRHPVIVLPEAAREWPAERLRVVLAHERMHVRRRDLLWQALAQSACIVYWFHPLVWWAASRLRLECEQSCDDGVLAQGERASDYAGHLVEVVRGITAEPRMAEGAIAMARFSELEQRVSALFHPNRGRGEATGRMMSLAAITAVAVLIPLASLRAPAQSTAAAPAEVKASAPASTQDRAVAEGVTGGVTGGVKGGIPGGVAGGVRASKAAAAETKRIKVEGSKQQAKLVNKVSPVYPPDCKAEGVQGSVLFRTVISKVGEPVEITLISEGSDSRLVDSARTAVKLWRWEPTLLNGEPVEVMTEIEVNFRLAK